MNRIRKYNDKYQVLITPVQPFNPSFELIFGGWTDEHLTNYYILEYDTLGAAQCKAFELPDIDWRVMVLNYKYAYHDIKDLIRNVLDRERFIVDFEPKFMTPEEVKNIMFDRIMNYGKRFTLVYHMNDIIHYHITNPWTKNCFEIAEKLINEPSLRIIKKIIHKGTILLVGKTNLGTTYEIVIWPTLIAQWAKWSQENKHLPKNIIEDHLTKSIKMQNNVDNGAVIR